MSSPSRSPFALAERAAATAARVRGPGTRRFRPRELPAGLEVLTELALDLRWTWSHSADALWSAVSPELWRRTKNPWLILQEVPQDRIEALAQSSELQELLAAVLDERSREAAAPRWFAASGHASVLGGVAFFCMEYGLDEALPFYAGGLGVLAGDYLKTASDLGLPLTGVGLLYHDGYFHQMLDADDRQREVYPANDPTMLPIRPALAGNGEWVRVALELPGRSAVFRIWRARVGDVELLLLDSNDPLNAPLDRGITGALYGGGTEMRFLQELALGVGGVRALEALGREVSVFHLNEGHAAFAVLERARLLRERTGLSFEEAFWATRAGNVFTTHTPVAAGFDAFPSTLIEPYLDVFAERTGADPRELLALGRQNRDDAAEPFHMAYLALRGSAHANAVSRLHGEVSRRLFAPLFARAPLSEIPIEHVTNGIHVPTWDSRWADEVWTRACGKDRWLGALDDVTCGVESVTDEELWTARTRSRADLIATARSRLEEQLRRRGEPDAKAARARSSLDPNALTIGLARRFAEYKRPTLLLSDPARLARLLGSRERPVQLVVAGKAHPDDLAGKELVHEWASFARRPDVRGRVVYLEDYEIALGQTLVQGVDLWLNCPRRPLEACGTSGMKVLVNGGLNVSTLDGWWAEAFSPEVGWAFGDGHAEGDERDALELYELLEARIVPEFYDRDERGLPRRWIARMRASMATLAPRFSSNRMLREYVSKLYVPAATAQAARLAEGGKRARGLAAWARGVRERWLGVRFGEVRVEGCEDGWSFRVPVYLGELDPASVRVEVYAEGDGARASVRRPLERREALAGSVGGYIFAGEAPADRPAEHYTARVLPCHEDAFVPIEAGEILWAR